MILFHHPGACSLADHIALIETGLSYKLIGINRDKLTEDGRDYLSVNPKGYVPSLELDDGTILTENPVILAYIAQQSGKLLPEGPARWRVFEALAFIASEVHANLRPFFKKAPAPEKRSGSDPVGQIFRLASR